MIEKDNPAVSVIIAMYNSEKYIGECLESLLNQSFQDFEVIVVDDCSTDFSRQVVYNFLSKFYGRLKMFKLRANSGCPGMPRNFALAEARGKYVYFLDSDDSLSEAALEELFNVAENFNADVVHCEKCFGFFDEDGKSKSEVISNQTGNFVTEPTLETFDIGERVTGFIQKKYLWWACNKLFRRKFLMDNKIRFCPMRIFEDMIFAFMCIVTAKNYVRVPFVSYYYRARKDSISHKRVYTMEKAKTTVEVFRALDDFMNSQRFFNENYQYQFKVFDFFMQYELDIISREFLIVHDLEPDALFRLFKEKFFPDNPGSYVALASYLFTIANVFKVQSLQQTLEIKELKTQVAELKK